MDHRPFERLRAKGMLSKYSQKDIMEISQSIHQICIIPNLKNNEPNT
jgi:hypothetical protein